MVFIPIFGLWYFLIFIFDLLPLFKRKKYLLFAVNMIMLSIAGGLQLCLVLEIQLPSMTALLTQGFAYLFLP